MHKVTKYNLPHKITTSEYCLNYKETYLCGMRRPARQGFIKKTGEVNEHASICRRLVETRHEKQLTQLDFSEMLGISLSSLKAIERGYFAPTVSLIIKWNKRFGKSLDWIFYGK